MRAYQLGSAACVLRPQGASGERIILIPDRSHTAEYRSIKVAKNTLEATPADTTTVKSGFHISFIEQAVPSQAPPPLWSPCPTGLLRLYIV